MTNGSNDLAKEIAALERVEEEVEAIWNCFSVDERMRNHGLEKRFLILRRILKGLREFYAWQRIARSRKI